MTTTSHSKKPAKNRNNKPRRKPIPKSIREKCLTAMQRSRRIEEADDRGYVVCISCGKPMEWMEAQGGHYVPRACRATELEPDNIWPQCPLCNGVRKGNLLAYRYNLVRRIGRERVERLDNLRAAYYGDEKAFELLAPEDKEIIGMSKGKTYYAEKYREIKERLRKAEAEL